MIKSVEEITESLSSLFSLKNLVLSLIFFDKREESHFFALQIEVLLNHLLLLIISSLSIVFVMIYLIMIE